VSSRTREALLVGLLAAAALYPTMRVVEALATAPVDPARVVYSEHSGYFWRIWLVLYAGAGVAVAAWMAPPRAGLVERALPFVAVALVAQAWFAP